MGQRREARKEIRLPVRIFGTDAAGRTFSENVFTVDVSLEGVRLTGVQAKLKIGETIGLAYGQGKGRFSVKWAGQTGTPKQGEIGLQNVSPSKPLWDFPLPPSAFDSYRGPTTKGPERRRHPRMKSMNSVEVHPEDQTAPIWGRATDLSVGGCFVEMQVPLRAGSKVKVGLWVNETKLWATGKVVNSRPGFGIGIEFAELSDVDADRLQQFLRSIARLPM
jgi:PilZ domain